jgi:hypothetical protein
VANIVRNPYSNTAGNTPSSLGNGQIGVNQADGRIFYRSSAGAVTTFSSIASFATTASFPATGSSSVLYLATDSSRLHQWTGTVYVEIGVSGGSGSSSYTLPVATSSTLGGVVVGTGLSVSSGTVSANVVSVAGRTGTVTISSSDVSGLPTAGTGSTNYCVGNDSRLSDSRTPSSHAASHASGGADAISIAASQITSGTVDKARLGSGTSDATTYLRGDQTWAAFSVADGSITTAKLAGPFTYDCGAYAAIVPAAPTGISGTPAVGSVALSWTAPTNTGGVSLTDYIVQYSTDQSSWTTFADGTSTATTATVTGLTGGTNYYFRVAAVNSAGTGAYVTSTAIAPSSSKITVARTGGSSTFSGSGTAASPYVRADRILNNAANNLTTYTFTAVASGTAYVTVTFFDDNNDGNSGYIMKNGVAQGGYISDGVTVTARSFSILSGDTITFTSNSTLTSFSNVSVYAI